MKKYTYDELPQEVKDLIGTLETVDETYETCKDIQVALNKIGWDCDYGLDAVITEFWEMGIKFHEFRQYDFEDNTKTYDWICIDEHTAHKIHAIGIGNLFYVRENAEGMIENDEDLEEAIEFDAVGIDGSYEWRSEWEQNHSRRLEFKDYVLEQIEKLMV